MNGGMVGGIVGSLLGVTGGLIGTAASIVNAKGSRERAMTIRMAALVWLGMGAMVAWALMMSGTWRQLTALWTIPICLAIPWMNRRLARARLEDESSGP